MTRNYNALNENSIISFKEGRVFGVGSSSNLNTIKKGKLAYIFGCILTLLLSINVNAQVSSNVNPTYGYTFLNTTTTYATLTGGTVFQSGVTLNTDAVSTAVSLPFPFTYNGIKENRIFISNNGFITFGIAPTATQYSPISSTTSSGYNGVISGFGVNAVQSTSVGSVPEIRYGSNGGGDFVVQYQDLGQSISAGVRMTFQIILKADGKTVQIVYGPNNVGFASASQVQVGLRGTNQQDFNNRTLASGGNWNTTGGATGTVAQAMSCTATTTLPTSGRTFQWSATAYTPTYLATPFATTQDFTTWTNGSGPNNVPSTNWATNGFGNASWQIDNTTATTTTSGWTGVSGAYSPVDFASAVGGRSARFHSFNATSPQVGYLDYYVDLSGGLGALTLDFYSINPTGVDILQVFLSTDGGATFAQVGTNIGASTTWTVRNISLGVVTSATSIIRFKATSDFGNDDIGIDNVKINQPAACPAPASLSATPSVNDAILNWSCIGCTGTFRVEYNTTPATFGGVGNIVVDPATSGLSISSLLASTNYTFFVRQDCGGAGLSTVSSFNFTTLAAGEVCTTANTITVAPNLGSSVNTLLTTGLTSDGPNGTCSDGTGNPSKKDRWVKFVAPSSGNKVIVTTSSGTISDAVMQVWSSCPASGVALGCSDDVVSLMPQLDFCNLIPGNTYYVQIWPYSATATGNFNIRIYEDTACPVPPANDECAGVETIDVGVAGSCPGDATLGTTVDASASPGIIKTTCDPFGTYNDVFYKFNSGSNTELNFAFTNLTGTNEFGIYGDCGITYLGVCSSSSLTTTLTGLTANTDYYIVVWANSAAVSGTFSICISALPLPNCVAAPTAPTNGGTVCAPSTTLSWPAVAGATTYDVYLDAGAGPATTLVSDNQTGTTYLATVSPGAYTWKIVPANSVGEAIGCVDFNFTANAAPAGDIFATAIDLGALSATTSVNGNNLAANCWTNAYTTSSTPGFTLAKASNDVFYKFEITECGSLLDIGTCTSSFDTFIHLLDSTGANINNDDDDCVGPNSAGSLISTLALNPGIYYVVVEGFGSGDTGTFTLDLTYTSGTPIPTWYADADTDTYGDPAVTFVGCTAPLGYVAVAGDCNDANAAINPGATEVCYDGLDNDCDGTIDDGCTPIVSTVQGTQCNTTLPLISTSIFANLVAGAQGYRFKVTDMSTMQVQTIDKVLRVFALTQLGNYAFNRTYQVEVAIRYNNVWQPFFGAPCTITTPETTTQLQGVQCPGTLTTMGDVLLANNVPYSTGYRFRVINLLTSAVSIIDRPTRDIRLNNNPGFTPEFNTTYSLEVSVRNTDGTYLMYGPACNVTTPLFPTSQLQLTQCDVTIASLNTTIFADSYPGASQYRFRFVNTPLGFSYAFDRPIRSFILSSVPGLLPSTTYSVQVALEINGVFGPFGKVCTLTTPPASKFESSVSQTDTNFNVVAYPNPFAESFKLDVTTSTEAIIVVKAYDMLGRLVDDRKVDVSTVSDFEIGSNYPSGVYNIVVSQGDSLQTLRVIKR